MRRRLGGVLVASLGLAGCLKGPSFLKQDQGTSASPEALLIAPVLSNSAGVVTAQVSASSGATQQVLAASNSAVAGDTVSFPPGTLAVSTNVTIQAGASLATTDTATSLGFSQPSTVTAASSAVVVSSTAATDAAAPFTVAISLSGGSSLLDAPPGTQYEVIYKVVKQSDGGSLFLGVIPPSLLTVADGAVSFSTIYFGSYQVVTTPAPVTVPKEVATSQPIVTAAQQVAQGTATGTSSATTPAVTDPAVQVTALTATSATLGWSAVPGASGYVVAEVTASGSLAPGCGGGAKLPATTTSYTATGLVSGTGYAFRVCALDGGGQPTLGAVVTATPPPPDVQSLAVTALSSSRLQVSWVPPAGIDSVQIVYLPGTPGGPALPAPANCAGVSVQTLPGNATQTQIAGITHLTPVAVRICTTQGGAVSPGVTQLATTPDWTSGSPTCANGGTLDTTCNLPAGPFSPPGGANPFRLSGAGTLVIPSGSKIVASPGQRLVVDMGAGVELGGTSEVQIVADAVGYVGSAAAGTNGAGPSGVGGGISGGSTSPGSGGANGGDGGFDPGYAQAGAAGFQIDNYTNPTDYGSGGGAAASGVGGNGGGAVEIDTGTLTLGNNTISANGQGATGTGGGGGGGGSLLLHVGALSSTATAGLVASGGAGTGGGGGGGGGRIALYYQQLQGSMPQLTVDGGAGGSACSQTAACDGAAGTIFESQTNVAGDATLWVEAVNHPVQGAAARTPIDPNAASLTQWQIGNNGGNGLARVFLTAPHDPTQATIQSLTIGSSGVIDESGLGFPGGGSGEAGRTATGAGPAEPGSPGGGGGGGHGGAGGAGGGSSGGTGGQVFDQPSQPTLMGGGGGGSPNGVGGAGGGVVRLTIAGTLTVQGQILANGAAASANTGGGGGAGGSIWITANEITSPNDSVELPAVVATGGQGASGTYGPGSGGGGGDILLVSPTITGVDCSVVGGAGYTAGSNGQSSGC